MQKTENKKIFEKVLNDFIKNSKNYLIRMKGEGLSMSQITTVNLFLLIFIFFYFLMKRRYRKFGYSPSNKLIDRDYKKWYRLYCTSMNRKRVTIYEIDRMILELKNILLKKGVTKTIVDDYIVMLEENDQKLGFKDLIIAVLGFISANSWVNDQLNKVNAKSLLSAINNEESKQKFLFLILIFSILLAVILLFVFLYIIFKVDSTNNENQKLVLLKRLSTIWDFDINTEVKTFDDLEKFRKNGSGNVDNIIYSKIEFPRSSIDKCIDNSIGDKVNIILSFFSDLFSNSKDGIAQIISKIINIIIGFTVFIMATTIIISLNLLFWIIDSMTINLVIRRVIFLLFLIFLVFAFILVFSIYNSQISINIDERKKLRDIADYQIVLIKKRVIWGWIQGILYFLVIAGTWYFLYFLWKEVHFNHPLFIILQGVFFSIFLIVGYIVTVEKNIQ
ncbi:hypothetical protein [Streptococcus equinus]|nr:hypothetical protein [Streptococcus equinus]